jgi:hypothetical protein
VFNRFPRYRETPLSRVRAPLFAKLAKSAKMLKNTCQHQRQRQTFMRLVKGYGGTKMALRVRCLLG